MDNKFTITEDYVSFETAKLLKEKGFNEMCQYCYADDGYRFSSRDTINTIVKDTFATAPTLQMAMKWLREAHNIHIELNPICTGDSNEDLEWHYGWAVRTTIFIDRWKRHDAEHISYEQACEAAIKYCLENLI